MKTDVNAPTAPKQVRARVREEQSLALRIGGATYAQIADALQISDEGARKAVKRALERTMVEVTNNAEALRELERQRLERLILSLMPSAQKGNVPAAETVRKLSESLRKLLGLNMPERVDVTSGGEKVELVIRYATDDKPPETPPETA